LDRSWFRKTKVLQCIAQRVVEVEVGKHKDFTKVTQCPVNTKPGKCRARNNINLYDQNT